MRTIIVICLCLLVCSCYNNDGATEKLDQMNQHITRLEQKIDSLIYGRNGSSNGATSTNNSTTFSYTTPRQADRCQAITKKGTQCKRKARNNNYCWQHGG